MVIKSLRFETHSLIICGLLVKIQRLGNKDKLMRADLFQEVTTISLIIRLNKVRDISNLLLRAFNSSMSIENDHPTLAIMRIVQEDRVIDLIFEQKQGLSSMCKRGITLLRTG